MEVLRFFLNYGLGEEGAKIKRRNVASVSRTDYEIKTISMKKPPAY